MQTKGVASVRSPVRNLQSFNPTVSHEAFVDAVISSFRDEYGIDGEVFLRVFARYPIEKSHNPHVAPKH